VEEMTAHMYDVELSDEREETTGICGVPEHLTGDIEAELIVSDIDDVDCTQCLAEWFGVEQDA
jgi:hypothetical protein